VYFRVLWMSSCFHTMAPVRQKLRQNYILLSLPCGGSALAAVSVCDYVVVIVFTGIT